MIVLVPVANARLCVCVCVSQRYRSSIIRRKESSCTMGTKRTGGGKERVITERERVNKAALLKGKKKRRMEEER